MKTAYCKKTLVAVSLLMAAGYADIASAHSGGGTIDPNGTNASASDLAVVTCFDDGNGTPHHLAAQVKDSSSPVSGLLLSLHLQKGNQMTTITDTVSGDTNYSPLITLNGGAGVYYMSVTKSNAGSRVFDVIWHCVTNNGDHTGTDIAVVQAQ